MRGAWPPEGGVSAAQETGARKQRVWVLATPKAPTPSPGDLGHFLSSQKSHPRWAARAPSAQSKCACLLGRKALPLGLFNKCVFDKPSVSYKSSSVRDCPSSFPRTKAGAIRLPTERSLQVVLGAEGDA